MDVAFWVFLIAVILFLAWIASVAWAFIVTYWPWSLCAVICFAGLVGYAIYTLDRRQAEARRLKKKARAKARRLEKKARAEAAAQERDATRRAADSAIQEFATNLTPCLVIDSNIWMNEQYDLFFLLLAAACLRRRYVLTLFGPQFDEIANIKRKTRFGEKRSRRARAAIHRIEELQKLRLLRIEPVTVEAQPGAYADPLLIDLVVSSAQKGIGCTFISDDRELRVRVRQHLTTCPNAKWSIVEMPSLSQQWDVIDRAIRLDVLGEWNKVKSLVTQIGEGEAQRMSSM